MRPLVVAVFVAAVAGAASAPPQTPDLAGTWKLDRARSRIGPLAAPPGLVKTGAPDVLHITHAANGTVIVESQINESQSRAYKPGRRTSTPVVPTGTISMTSRWDGATLVAEGTLDAGGAPVAVREAFALGADGRTLTIEIALTGPAGPSASALVYVRAQGVGPCTTWPTPCRTFQQADNGGS